MAHAHIVSDSDNHFVIDPISRQLSNNSKKTILMKTDHNSEQFTFELPRMVEGHDMSLSNKVEVHYININSKTREQSTGIYNVADFGVDTEDDTKVLGTWLVSREATKYAGSLNFVIRFACLSADNVEEYAWNTAIYAGITIADTIENTETVVEDYVDILRQWLDTIENAGSSGKVYVITDDGTITELGEMVNNFSTQLSETNAKFEELKTANDQFKEDINQEINQFKDETNQNIDNFKASVNQKTEEMVQEFNGLETTVNTFNDRITDLETDPSWNQVRTDSNDFKTKKIFEPGVYEVYLGNIAFPLLKFNPDGEHYQEFVISATLYSDSDSYIGLTLITICINPDGKIIDSHTYRRYISFADNKAPLLDDKTLLSTTNDVLFYRRIRTV